MEVSRLRQEISASPTEDEESRFRGLTRLTAGTANSGTHLDASDTALRLSGIGLT
jgi:hypothetical protein